MIQMKWGEMGNGEEKESRNCDTEIVREVNPGLKRERKRKERTGNYREGEIKGSYNCNMKKLS
jgi:hypothetical protein